MNHYTPVEHLTLNGHEPAGLDRLGEVRDFVRRIAANANLTEERTFDLMVAVSEATANAIEHGGAEDLEISAEVDREYVTMSVSHSGEFRVPPRSDNPIDRGLGLPLMAALCDDLAVCRTEDGTRVTIRFWR